MTRAAGDVPGLARTEAIGPEETRFSNQFVKLTETPVRLPDGQGTSYAKFTSGDGHGAVTIPRVVIRGFTYFGLVRQFRFPLGQVTYEFPRGNTSDASAAEALRELGEETGIDISTVEPVHLGFIHPDTGVMTNRVGVWLATVRVDAQPNALTAEPGVLNCWVSSGELHGMIHNGRISCGITIAAFGKLVASGHQTVAS